MLSAGNQLLTPQFGLGRIVDVCLQTAINKVAGNPQPHHYLNSPPLYTESAFEFVEDPLLGLGATDVGARAFQSYSHPQAELDSHYIYQRLNGQNDTILSLTLGGTLSVLSGRNIGTLVLNTGMSAFGATFDLLRPGDTLFFNPVLYGCTKNEVVAHLPKMGIKVVPDTLEDVSAMRARLLADESARMMVTETLLNPTLDLPPTDELAEMTDEVNGQRLAKGWRPVFFVVDNTFPTFANMNVFGHGVHIDIESLTKFISGKGENRGGMLAVDLGYDAHLTQEDYGALYNFFAMRQKDRGLSMAPFVAWDIARSLPDIEMRREHVQQNAFVVAQFLKEHPQVASLKYPGMTDNSVQDRRARRLMLNEYGKFAPGNMIYFELAGQTPEESVARAKKLLDWASRETSLRVKVSFGQRTTNLELPPAMTHSSYSPAELQAAGIGTGIRLAMGWDNSAYVIDSLGEGLKVAYAD